MHRGLIAYIVYLATLSIKGLDGLIETALGLLISVAGPHRIYLAVLHITSPELELHPGDRAIAALQHGAAGLSHASPSFSIFYLLVHGVLKSAIAASLLLNKRWIFPYAAAILTAFVGLLSYKAAVGASGIITALAVFDIFTLAVVVKEWRWPYHRSSR